MTDALTRSAIDQQIERLEYRNQAFIDGRFVAARSGATFATLNPATGQVLTEVAACDAEDIDLAVKAARAAFESGVWSKLAPAGRKAIMQRFADLIDAHRLELAVLESLESGKPVGECFAIDIPDTAATIRWHAEAGDKLYDAISPSCPGNLGMIRREPVGVV